MDDALKQLVPYRMNQDMGMVIHHDIGEQIIVGVRTVVQRFDDKRFFLGIQISGIGPEAPSHKIRGSLQPPVRKFSSVNPEIFHGL